jgi:phenylacetate-coenzyme A ligase PaaK-like adenylate-forming protein
MFVPFSLFYETQWPALPSPYAARVLAVLFQLEHTQWWSAEELASRQFHQLKRTLCHAYETVPFYQTRFDASDLTPV